MAPDNEGSNGRVTLAVLGEKVDNLSEDVRRWHDDHEERMREVETKATKNEEQHRWLWGGQIGTVLGTIGGILGLPK